MVQLYILSQDCERLRSLADQAGTPEDEAMFLEAMRAVEGDIAVKADRMAALMTEFQAEADALQHEENRLYARRKSIESNRARLGDYLKRELEIAGMDRVKGPRFSLLIQSNPGRVVIDEESKLPEAFWVTKREPNKRDILGAFKSGQAVPGCRLEESSSLRIR